MFDISFFELLVVGVVGLIVIGPERLPGTVRTCALWIGRIKRSLLETRRELEKQIGADEIRRELHNEQVLINLEKMKDTRLELEERIRQLGASEMPAEGSSSGAANSVADETTASPKPELAAAPPEHPANAQEAPQAPATHSPKH